MIRHRPSGSGHPYSDDTEQRSPVQPVAGEPLRLGVRTSGDIDAVTVELRVDDADAVILPLARVARSSRGQAVDGGHLASAQARTARAAGGGQGELEAPPPRSGLRDRVRSAGPPRGGMWAVELLASTPPRLLPEAARPHPPAPLLEAGAPATRHCSATPMPLLHALAAAGVPARLSRDAGGYVCNALSWSAYGWARRDARMPLAVFVHIPRPRASGPLDRARLLRGLAKLMVALGAQHRLRAAAGR